MTDKPQIAVLMTLDSKADVARYVVDRIAQSGGNVRLIDLSLRAHSHDGAEQTGEVMKGAQVIPQAPAGRSTARGDIPQLVCDGHDRCVQTTEFRAARHAHDVGLLETRDDLIADATGAIGCRGLCADGVE